MTSHPGADRRARHPSSFDTNADLAPRPDKDAPFAPSCLSLDLEVGAQDSRIHAFGAVRPDTDQRLVFSGGNLTAALAQLDELAQGANFLLGHNLITFDLPHLTAAKPDLRLLHLPAVDTLWLNPLAFPRNPYHHLVKHYQDGQLTRGRLNDPELDARLALDVFRDQCQALRKAPPDLLLAWHWLTTADKQGSAGFNRVFSNLRRTHRPADTEARAAIRKQLEGRACLTHAPRNHAGCRPTRLATGLRPGMAIGVRQQLRHAALGPPPIPGGRPTRASLTGHRLPRSRLHLVPRATRRPQGTHAAGSALPPFVPSRHNQTVAPCNKPSSRPP